MTGTDPGAGAEAARAAAAQLRRAGARTRLAFAVANLAQALLMTGDWDAAEAELARAADADGLADIEYLACYRAWLAALRGDAPAAQAALAGLGDLRASEDPQDQAIIAVAEAFTAAARRQPAAALRHARAALDARRRPGDQRRGPAVGLAAGRPRRARPGRHRHHAGLLALLDGYRPGQLAPMQRAERDLARARLAAAGGDPDAGPAFAAAITGCASTPPPTTWPTACSTTPPTSATSARPGRGGRGRRSRRHRPAAGLPAAAGPRGHHPARQAAHRGLVMTAPARPGRPLPRTRPLIHAHNDRSCAAQMNGASDKTAAQNGGYSRPGEAISSDKA